MTPGQIKALLKNPIVQKYAQESRDKGRSFGVAATILIAIQTLNDDFGFDVEMLTKFYNRVDYMADSMLKDYVKLPDFIEALRDEGFKLNDDDIQTILTGVSEY